MKGINVKETVDYISRSDKSENPTVFKLGVLSARQRSELLSDVLVFKGKDIDFDIKKVNDRALDLVKAGLKKIRGIEIDGKMIDVDEVKEEHLEYLPTVVINELAFQIVHINFVGNDEIKN